MPKKPTSFKFPFHPGETLDGWRHLSLRWQRLWLRRPPDYYIDRHPWPATAKGQGRDRAGNPDTCQMCGYRIIRLEMPGGWLLQMCSALPTIKNPDAASFKLWLETLTGRELPTPSR